jgi:hypothetical protein
MEILEVQVYSQVESKLVPVVAEQAYLELGLTQVVGIE